MHDNQLPAGQISRQGVQPGLVSLVKILALSAFSLPVHALSLPVLLSVVLLNFIGKSLRISLALLFWDFIMFIGIAIMFGFSKLSEGNIWPDQSVVIIRYIFIYKLKFLIDSKIYLSFVKQWEPLIHRSLAPVSHGLTTTTYLTFPPTICHRAFPSCWPASAYIISTCIPAGIRGHLPVS